jgi:hypothetical protein
VCDIPCSAHNLACRGGTRHVVFFVEAHMVVVGYHERCGGVESLWLL